MATFYLRHPELGYWAGDGHGFVPLLQQSPTIGDLKAASLLLNDIRAERGADVAEATQILVREDDGSLRAL